MRRMRHLSLAGSLIPSRSPLLRSPSLENRALGGVCSLKGFGGFYFFIFFLNKWKAELSLMEMDEAGLASPQPCSGVAMAPMA